MHDNVRTASRKGHLSSILHLDGNLLSNFPEGAIRSISVLTLGGAGLAKDVVSTLVFGLIHGEEWVNQSLIVGLVALARRRTFGDTATDGFVALCGMERGGRIRVIIRLHSALLLAINRGVLIIARRVNIELIWQEHTTYLVTPFSIFPGARAFPFAPFFFTTETVRFGVVVVPLVLDAGEEVRGPGVKPIAPPSLRTTPRR